MKKLMTLMLGMSLAIGCVGVTFAEDTAKPKKEKTKKPAKKKKDTTSTHKGA